MSDTLLDPRQAAEMIGVSPASLARWRVQGDGPPYLKLGGSVRYRLSSVEQWLTASERRSTADVPADHAPAA